MFRFFPFLCIKKLLCNHNLDRFQKDNKFFFFQFLNEYLLRVLYFCIHKKILYLYCKILISLIFHICGDHDNMLEFVFFFLFNIFQKENEKIICCNFSIYKSLLKHITFLLDQWFVRMVCDNFLKKEDGPCIYRNWSHQP